MEGAGTPPSFVFDHYESTHDECDIVVGHGSTWLSFGKSWGFPRRFVPGVPLLFFPQRATWASVKTMTRVLTSSLAAPQESSSAFRLPNRQPSQHRISARYPVDEP
jgi:hypothetical protein